MVTERDYVYCTGCWWCARPPVPSDGRCPRCNSALAERPPERGPLGVDLAAGSAVWLLQAEILVLTPRRCCAVVRGLRPYMPPRYSHYPLSNDAAVLAARQLAADMAGRRPYDLVPSLRFIDTAGELPKSVWEEGSDG